MTTSNYTRRGFIGGAAITAASLALTACSTGSGTSSASKSDSSASTVSPKTDFSETTGDKLKITTLSENTNTGHERLSAEFGFSALITLGDNSIIFDTAKKGDFIEHAQQLDADLAKCKTMVLSHAHYDHCGGVMKYYNMFSGKDRSIYLKDCFFDGASEKYYDDISGQKLDFTNGKPGYFNIGISFTEDELKATGVNIKYMKGDSEQLFPGIKLHGNFVRDPLDPKMLIKNEKGQYVVDDFDEEVAISVETSKGLIVVSGCSHTGIENIVQAIKEREGKNVYAVIGGFHLLDATEQQIQNSIDTFSGLGVSHMGVSHCIGDKAKKMFCEQLPDIAFVNTTGSIFEMK